MRIVCVRHVPYEGPGSIAEWAVGHCHDLREVTAADGRFPASDTFEMLVVLGGPMGAADVDRHPWLVEEKRFIAEAVGAGRLVLGVCLGSQLLAEAIGGRVRRGPVPEIGWYPVRLTPSGRASSLFAGWPDEMPAGHWHGDTFDLPSGVVPSASSDVTVNQAFEAADGRAVGLQFHLEWTRVSLTALADACGDELTEAPTVRSREALLAPDAPFEASRARLFSLLDALEARL